MEITLLFALPLMLIAILVCIGLAMYYIFRDTPDPRDYREHIEFRPQKHMDRGFINEHDSPDI